MENFSRVFGVLCVIAILKMTAILGKIAVFLMRFSKHKDLPEE